MDKKEKYSRFAKLLLKRSRSIVANSNHNEDRLPDWVDNAKVKIGYLHHTTVFLFTPSIQDRDTFEFYGEVSSLIDIVTEIPEKYGGNEYTPFHPLKLTSPKQQSTHLLGKGGGERKSPILSIDKETPNLFDVRKSHHPPIFISNNFIKFEPEDVPIVTGYIPFALMIHNYDFENMEHLLNRFERNLSQYLDIVHDSGTGDYYEGRTGEKRSITTNKKNSVIVLGDYDGGENEEELHRVREELETEGYKVSLIKELPDHSSQSLPQKVKMWCLTSRFVVLVDRDPSGHIREYTELSKEDIPLALLKKSDSGSTYMIGHEHMTDDYIELFEFDNHPTEVSEKAVHWAEEFIDRLSEMYDEQYPWR